MFMANISMLVVALVTLKAKAYEVWTPPLTIL